MNTLRSFGSSAWLILLPICLISFVPLALNADGVGGIPSWAYWQLGLMLTLGLSVWAVASTVRYWFNSRRHPMPEAV